MSRSPRVLADVRGRPAGDAALLCADAAGCLAQLARRAGLGPRHELSLLLTDNDAIRRLNRRWRGLDQPTDVLSFPLHVLKEGTPPGPGPVGDIVISLPYARRAARELGLELDRHLAWLLAHGLLHLLGYDHERSAAAARRMRSAERRLLEGKLPDE